MDEDHSLDEGSSPNRYRSLEENHIFYKYRNLDKTRLLEPRFLRQLISSLWDIRPSHYTCQYLDERDPAYWVLSPIKDMSSENSQESSRDAPNSSSSQPTSRSNPPQQHDPQVTEVNQTILGQGTSNEVVDPEPIFILPPLNTNPNMPHSNSPSTEGSQTCGTPVASEEVLTAALSSVEPRIGRPARKEVLDLTKESLPSPSLDNTSAIPGGADMFEAPFADSPVVIGDFSKGKESDSALKVTAGYSNTYLNLPYTLPGGYESRRLDVDLRLNREGERVSHFKMQELEKENEALLRNQKTSYNEKKIANEQELAKIAKCKELEAQNIKLEGEKFDLTLKLSRLELSLSQEKK
ncbi:hypothetical protein LIER_23878 [Lithospermum erythrorhizon]|uniref:Uncharacterized protein n=1 Tax=Lithospermum erythrorhizon TaxID=34254 RepID=A0AAV3R0A3_LITER